MNTVSIGFDGPVLDYLPIASQIRFPETTHYSRGALPEDSLVYTEKEMKRGAANLRWAGGCVQRIYFCVLMSLKRQVHAAHGRIALPKPTSVLYLSKYFGGGGGVGSVAEL